MEIELKVNVALPNGNNVAAIATFDVDDCEANIFALESEDDGEAMAISLLTEDQLDALQLKAIEARNEDEEEGGYDD